MSAAALLAFGMPGYGELLMLLVVGLLIFGRRLPEVGHNLGKTIVQLRRGFQDFKNQIRDDEDLRDVKSTVRELNKAVEAPSKLKDPAKLLDDLTDETLSTPGPGESST